MTGFARLSGPARGALWMIAQAAMFAFMVVAVRTLSPAYSVFVLVFARSIFGIAFQLPWLFRGGWRELRTPQWKAVLLRGVAMYLGTYAWFMGLTLIPLADAVALNFTTPIFAVLGAALVFSERLGPARVLAALVGFAGALIIVRPGFHEVTLATFLVVGAAACFAWVHLATKTLLKSLSGAAIAFHGSVVMLPLSLATAVPEWTTPALPDLPMMAAIGLTGLLAHIFLARAYGAADAGVVAPFDFFRLIFASLVGWLLFGETSDIFVWLGAIVIFASTTGLTVYETRRDRRARPAGVKF